MVIVYTAVREGTTALNARSLAATAISVIQMMVPVRYAALAGGEIRVNSSAVPHVQEVGQVMKECAGSLMDIASLDVKLVTMEETVELSVLAQIV
jgi:hypothetical protein